MSGYVCAIVASGQLPSDSRTIAWVAETVERLVSLRAHDTLWVTTNTTLGDRAVASELSNHGGRLFVYTPEERVEYRGGTRYMSQARRLRNIDHEMLMDMDRSREHERELTLDVLVPDGPDDDMDVMIEFAEHYCVHARVHLFGQEEMDDGSDQPAALPESSKWRRVR